MQLCYREDEGRPLEFALQEVISNRHKLLWSKATVVSVMGKGEARLLQVSALETNANEPVYISKPPFMSSKPGSPRELGMSLEDTLFTDQTMTGI